MAARWDTDSRLRRCGASGCSWLACAALLGAVLCPARARASTAHVVASHTWTAVSTPHVDVLTDAGREVGERVAEQLEDLRTVLSLAAPSLVAGVAPVQVIVFRDAELAANYAPTWHGQRDQVGGFFQRYPTIGSMGSGTRWGRISSGAASHSGGFARAPLQPESR